jgi:hypothetical protein
MTIRASERVLEVNSTTQAFRESESPLIRDVYNAEAAALGVMKRGFALLHENWSRVGLRRTLRAPSALKVEEPWCP